MLSGAHVSNAHNDPYRKVLRNALRLLHGVCRNRGGAGQLCHRVVNGRRPRILKSADTYGAWPRHVTSAIGADAYDSSGIPPSNCCFAVWRAEELRGVARGPLCTFSCSPCLGPQRPSGALTGCGPNNVLAPLAHTSCASCGLKPQQRAIEHCTGLLPSLAVGSAGAPTQLAWGELPTRRSCNSLRRNNGQQLLRTVGQSFINSLRADARVHLSHTCHAASQPRGRGH